ncbi:nitroreductase/quinone reductase family protein (plasmid) [Haladaptatus sp. SPP-AMP-3]|uniref:nitroreductase/quinone reductase family protein n=1 Tax=Haladaptatus sp. SPP-AMP-3 TaxID=3121295 RepID=UPI003C2E0E83
MPTDDATRGDGGGGRTVEIRAPPTPFFLLERYVANPVLRRLLRSKAHWLVSNRLMLLSYVGRRSGTRYTTPVAYDRREDTLVATTLRHHSNWWKNFREEHPATVWLRGTRRKTTGLATTDTREIAEFVRSALVRYGIERARWLGLKIEGDELPTVEELEAVAPELVVVRFSIDDLEPVFQTLHIREEEFSNRFGTEVPS